MNKKFEKLAHSVNKAAQRILPLFIVLGGGGQRLQLAALTAETKLRRT